MTLMVIQRLSMWSGKIHGMDLPITPSQLIDWMTGTLIQQAMPDLEPYQREFLISGMTPDEWVEMTAGQQDARDERTTQAASGSPAIHEMKEPEHRSRRYRHHVE